MTFTIGTLQLTADELSSLELIRFFESMPHARPHITREFVRRSQVDRRSVDRGTPDRRKQD